MCVSLGLWSFRSLENWRARKLVNSYPGEPRAQNDPLSESRTLKRSRRPQFFGGKTIELYKQRRQSWICFDSHVCQNSR